MIPLTQAVPGDLQASWPMLDVNVSTYLAPLALAALRSTVLSDVSSELMYVMSPAEIGTSGQQAGAVGGQAVGIADDHHLGLRGAGVDALDDRRHLGAGGVDRRHVGSLPPEV